MKSLLPMLLILLGGASIAAGLQGTNPVTLLKSILTNSDLPTPPIQGPATNGSPGSENGGPDTASYTVTPSSTNSIRTDV